MHELKMSKNATSADTVKDYFFANADYSQVKIKFSDIKWIEGVRDYIKIHLTSVAKPIMLRSSLKSMED